MPEEYFEELRKRRLLALHKISTTLIDAQILPKKELRLDRVLVNQVVEKYLSDHGILKSRYKIEGKIQVHKIAGLMAAAIVRYRPLVPNDVEQTESSLMANEKLAIMHGLSICAEFDENKLGDFLCEPFFKKWWETMLFLLHDRNHTPESIMVIFQTLSYTYFPNSFVK